MNFIKHYASWLIENNINCEELFIISNKIKQKNLFQSDIETCNEETRKVLNLLYRKKRLNYLNNIIDEYEKRKKGNGLVVSAQEFNENEKKDIIKKLEKLFGMELKLNWIIDNNLLYGFWAEVSNKRIDFSFKRLKDLKIKKIVSSLINNIKLIR